MAEAILANPYNGSCKKWRSAQIHSARENGHTVKFHLLPKEATLRRIVYEYRNYNSHGFWEDLLKDTAKNIADTLPARLIKGYVQQIRVDHMLVVHNFSETQLQCLKLTPYEHRIGHFDATGGLVHINHRQHDGSINPFKRILNYTLLVKNSAIPTLENSENKFQLGS